jgi:ABC-type sugar transport system ATPase subunit
VTLARRGTDPTTDTHPRRIEPDPTVATLELDDITKQFGPSLVLRGVSLAADGGEVHALVGENGAGKSTLLNIMSGVVAPTSGAMTLRGELVPFDGLAPDQTQRLGVAVVHQELSLVPGMTVAENVFLGRELRRFGLIDRRRMVTETAALLERLGSSISPRAVVESLNVASVQIVEIAKALSIDADVVAMDEPSAVLSGAELEQLFEVVATLKNQGVAVLYVSHRLDEVFAICDRYTVLKDGVVSGSGSIAEIDRDDLVRMMVGREVAQVFRPASNPPGPARLEVRDLRVAGLAAPVSFHVAGREIVGLVGLNGVGRTTLVKGLFGAVPAVGEILIDGVSHDAFAAPGRAMDSGLAMLPEDRRDEGLALGKSVRWNTSLNILGRLRRGGVIDERAEARFAGAAVERFAIRTHPDGRAAAATLSGGNQQKVVLAKWLASEPKVLVLDEPTRGIDVGSKEQIYDLIRDLADDGMAVLVISSELVEILELSDRVLVMADGRIVAELPRAAATEENVLRIITSHTAHATVDDDPDGGA